MRKASKQTVPGNVPSALVIHFSHPLSFLRFASYPKRLDPDKLVSQVSTKREWAVRLYNNTIYPKKNAHPESLAHWQVVTKGLGRVEFETQ